MSLTLAGQLGRAQLGTAQLGQLSTGSAGAGFLPIFPDVGPLKQAPKKKKAKKAKKAKKPKKAKRVKIAASAPNKPTPVLTHGPTDATVPEPSPVLSLALQEELDRQARLRETIAEDDELIALLWKC